MRVVIFGANGRVCAVAVRMAATAGSVVRAAVRRIPEPSPFDTAVTFAVVDVLEPATVRAAVAGMDAVIVAVGSDVVKPSTVVTQSADVIVAAMHAESCATLHRHYRRGADAPVAHGEDRGCGFACVTDQARG